MAKNISFTLKFWRQNGPKDKGHFETHQMKDIPDDTSFLEMLDILNEELIEAGEEPFVFDHDCLFTSTVHLMVRPSVEQLPVSCICVASKMAIPSLLSLGVLLASQ